MSIKARLFLDSSVIRILSIVILLTFFSSTKDLVAQDNSDISVKDSLLSAKRVVFLGDSNTHAGGYIDQFEAALRENFDSVPEIINLGLPSETCCGLSEPIHPFPRPTVQERLTRVLETTQPSVVVACYGMNDGIYHPFAEDRFKAVQTGIEKLIATHATANVRLILMTPPPFDPLPMQKSGKLVDRESKEFSWKAIYKNYDSEVMKKYADWMLTLNKPKCKIIDIHTPLNNYLAEKRKSDPDFAFSNDGVHVDARGHRVLASTLLKALDFKIELSKSESLIGLIKQKRTIMHPAWLTKVGHKRPKVKPGLPIEKAEQKVAPLNERISKLLKAGSSH